MNMEIFEKVENEIKNIKELGAKKVALETKLMEAEEEAIINESNLINSEAFKSLKNANERKAFLSKELIQENRKIGEIKRNIKLLENEIEFHRNMKSMYNRMIDNFDGLNGD